MFSQYLNPGETIRLRDCERNIRAFVCWHWTVRQILKETFGRMCEIHYNSKFSMIWLNFDILHFNIQHKKLKADVICTVYTLQYLNTTQECYYHFEPKLQFAVRLLKQTSSHRNLPIRIKEESSTLTEVQSTLGSGKLRTTYNNQWPLSWLLLSELENTKGKKRSLIITDHSYKRFDPEFFITWKHSVYWIMWKTNLTASINFFLGY